MKQHCVKLCKTSRLIKASMHTSIKLVQMCSIGERSGDIDGHSIILTLSAVKNCVVARAVWGRALSCCSIVTPLPASMNGKTTGTRKVSKGAKIRNRYNQVPLLTQDTNRKVTNSQLDTTNKIQEAGPFPAGDRKAHKRAQRHSKHKTEKT